MTIELIDTAKRRAGSAIENVWKEYTREDDGLKLLEQKTAVSQSKCSAYIYGLAQYAVDICPKRRKPHELFSAMCAYAESQLKEKHEVDNLKEALPVWAVYKSYILAGMREGLDPNAYPTEWEFRKATAAERGPVLVTTSPSHEARSDEVTQEKLTIEPTRKWLRPVPMANSIKLILAQLVVEAGYIRAGKEDEAEAIIRECREKLSALIDKRRITDEATKDALKPAA